MNDSKLRENLTDQDDPEFLRLLPHLHPTLLLWLWTMVGALLAGGAFAAASGIPGGLVTLTVGLVGTVVLAMRRVPRNIGFLGGVLVGINLFAIILVLRPPCRSRGDVRLVVDGGEINLVCDQFQDVTATVASVFIGSVVIGGLVISLKRIRSRRVNPLS